MESGNSGELHTTQQAQCFSISISELTYVSKTAKAKRTTKNKTIITPAAKRSKFFRLVNTGSVWSDDTSVVGNKKIKGTLCHTTRGYQTVSMIQA